MAYSLYDLRLEGSRKAAEKEISFLSLKNRNPTFASPFNIIYLFLTYLLADIIKFKFIFSF